ncbi:MAG TPA: PEGA domain-containing protein [Planctomycetota bacterium]|nr:PEGA domain-containing protein [Planctomycetota bacterium]
MLSLIRIGAVCLTLLILSGCTSRGMTVTSNPPGAELSINRRVVGKTPMRVGFTHYGTYRFELRKKGYEVLVKEEDIKPGFYGYDPAAFVADNVIPARLNDEIYIHYNMKAIDQDVAASGAEKSEGEKSEKDTSEKAEKPKDSRAALLDRANAARAGRVVHPKSGEEVAIELGREPKKLSSAAVEEEIAGTSEAPPPAVVVDTEPTREIVGKRPEGLRIAGEYGISGEEEKRGNFERPEPKKTETPKEARVPKEEELVYDQPEVTDPAAKAGAKPADPAKTPAKPTEPAKSSAPTKEPVKALEKKENAAKK